MYYLSAIFSILPYFYPYVSLKVVFEWLLLMVFLFRVRNKYVYFILLLPLTLPLLLLLPLLHLFLHLLLLLLLLLPLLLLVFFLLFGDCFNFSFPFLFFTFSFSSLFCILFINRLYYFLLLNHLFYFPPNIYFIPVLSQLSLWFCVTLITVSYFLLITLLYT